MKKRYSDNLLLFIISSLVCFVILLGVGELIFYFREGHWYAQGSKKFYAKHYGKGTEGKELENRDNEQRFLSFTLGEFKKGKTKDFIYYYQLLPNLNLDDSWSLTFSVWVKAKTKQDAVALLSFVNPRPYTNKSPFVDRVKKIRLENFDIGYAKSFHSGDGKWHLLSVTLAPLFDYEKISLGVTTKTDNIEIGQANLIAAKRELFQSRDSLLFPQYRAPINYKKDESVTRIVCIGGSTTFCITDNWDFETYPYILEQKLNSLSPGKFEVLNLGIEAYDSRQLLECTLDKSAPDVEYNWLDLKPDIVILAPCWNDTYMPLLKGWRKITFLRYIGSLFERLGRYCALGNYLLAIVEDSWYLHASEKHQYNKHEKMVHQLKEHSITRVARLVEVYQADGARVYLLRLPASTVRDYSSEEMNIIKDKLPRMHHWYIQNKKWVELAHNFTREVFSEVSDLTGCKVIDATNINSLSLPEVLSSFFTADSIHKKRPGNQLVADRVFDILYEDLL